MTTPPGRPRPRRRRHRVPRGVITALLFVLVFLLGVALGQALHDNPKPGLTNTIVRTFRP